MVVVRFSGGLGNQLFQYAFAKSIAQKYDLELKMDVSFYDSVDNRSFVLHQLGIELDIASERQIAELQHKISQKGQLLRRNRYYLLKEEESRYFQYDPACFNLYKPKGIYIDGYWQNPKYFQVSLDYDVLKSNDQNPEVEDLLTKIRSQESVAIHVRRGDFAKDQDINKIHGTCSLEYYQSAIDMIEKQHENIQFYVFSDDLLWCRKKFQHKSFQFVSLPEQREWIDFLLLANCKHQIISNSTFSWWAAWLNEYPGKKIIAPKKWFNNEQWDTSELIPENWHRI